MISDLFINVLLFISVTFIFGHILKDISTDAVDTIYAKILLGISGGFFGILQMIYTLKIDGTTTILDLRNFALIIVSHVGGIIPTIVSAIIIGLYRTLYFGVTKSSLMVVFQMILYSICFHIIDKKIKSDWKKWFFKTLSMLTILLFILIYLLKNVENYQVILFKYFIVNILVSVLEYTLLGYAKTSNKLYRMYKKDSTKDFLTGLNNVRQFDSIFNYIVKNTKEQGKKLSILMIDIDFFKKINDTYGHAEGDVVLRELGKILLNNCRRSDIVSRNGGEEFTILLLDCSPIQAMQTAERVRSDVEKHPFVLSNGTQINITVSIGVASYPEDTNEVEKLLDLADTALYTAKRTGRNKVRSSSVRFNVLHS
ncbi:diguanylate cyclase [Clostridium sp. WILCCON 0269]|uniref:Diguanylate cyclase n=1 Tax=Candidatus Clostridium eludens TaxID=3381663 RepID=A0ABW8SRN2_9CLOT